MNIKIPKTEWQPSKNDRNADKKSMGVLQTLGKPIVPKPSSWGDIGLNPPIPLREFKGINTMDPLSIGDEFATRTKNISTKDYPAFSVRSGYTLFGSQLASTIKGLGVWKDNEIHAVSNGIWSKWNGSTWSNLATGLNTTNPWTFSNFKGNYADVNLLATNGVDAMRRYDGSSVSIVSTAPAGANFVDQHDNRAYCAVGNTVYASSLKNSENWTAPKDSSIFVLDNPKGEVVTALKAGSGHVVVFMPTTMYELWGTGYKDFRMQIVADDIGCVNNQSVVNLNGVLYFLDIRHIYKYSGGTQPDYGFSIPIQGYIDQINPAAKDKCCMGTDGKNLYISIPYQTSTVANITLEYDPNFGIWNVWQDILPTTFTRMNNVWYAGDISGRILKMGGTATDNGTGISWEWVSKPFGHDRITAYGTVIAASRAQRVQWHSIWYVADIPTGSNMDVYLSRSATGDTDWVLAKSFVSSTSLQSGKVMIPVGSLANTNVARLRFVGTGPVIVHEIDRQVRDIPLI